MRSSDIIQCPIKKSWMKYVSTILLLLLPWTIGSQPVSNNSEIKIEDQEQDSSEVSSNQSNEVCSPDDFKGIISVDEETYQVAAKGALATVITIAAIAQPFTAKLTTRIVNSLANYLKNSIFEPFINSFLTELGEKLCTLADEIEQQKEAAYNQGYEEAKADSAREYMPRIQGLEATITNLNLQIESLKTSGLFSSIGAAGAGAAFGIFATKVLD